MSRLRQHRSAQFGVNAGVDKRHILKESLRIDGRLRSETSRECIYEFLMTNRMFADAMAGCLEEQRDKLIRSCYLKVLTSADKPLFLTFKDKIISDCFAVIDYSTPLNLVDYYTLYRNPHHNSHGEKNNTDTKDPIHTHQNSQQPFSTQYCYKEVTDAHKSKSFITKQFAGGHLHYKEHAFLFGHQLLKGDNKWDMTTYLREGCHTCSLLCIPAALVLECIGYGGPSVRESLEIFWKFLRLDKILTKEYRTSLHLEPLYSTTIYGDVTPIPLYPRCDVLDTGRILVFPPHCDIFVQHSKRNFLYFIIHGECALLRKFDGWQTLNMSQAEVDLGLRYLPGDFVFLDSENRSWIDKYKRSLKDTIKLQRKMLNLDKTGGEHAQEMEELFPPEKEPEGPKKEEVFTAAMYDEFLTESDLYDFGRHKNSLYCLTRVEVCVVPLQEIAGNNYLFEELLKLSEKKYPKTLANDERIITEYHKNRIWEKDRIDVLNAAVRDTISRVPWTPVSIDTNVNRQYLLERDPGGCQFTPKFQMRDVEWKAKKDLTSSTATTSRIFLEMLSCINSVDPNTLEELEKGNIVSEKEKHSSKYIVKSLKTLDEERRDIIDEITRRAKAPTRATYEPILKVGVPVVDKNAFFDDILHPKTVFSSKKYPSLKNSQNNPNPNDASSVETKPKGTAMSVKFSQAVSYGDNDKESCVFLPAPTKTSDDFQSRKEFSETKSAEIERPLSKSLHSRGQSPRSCLSSRSSSPLKDKVLISKTDTYATGSYMPAQQHNLDDKSHDIVLTERPMSHQHMRQRPYTSQDSDCARQLSSAFPIRPATAKSSRQIEVTNRPRSANPIKVASKSKLTFDD